MSPNSPNFPNSGDNFHTFLLNDCEDQSGGDLLAVSAATINIADLVGDHDP